MTDQLLSVLRATWPAAATQQVGPADAPVTLREGRGGGSRVCAATADGPIDAQTLQDAAQAMRAMGQSPLWQITPQQGALDAQLAAAGYAMTDETVLMSSPVAPIAALDLKAVRAFRAWPPLAIQREIWDSSEIGPERRAVMARAPHPKTSFLGREDDSPAGAAFAAIHDGVAMVHALTVLPAFRRKGLARWLMVAAARWAQEHQIDTIAIAVTQKNEGARALYADLGFVTHPGYHYRLLRDGDV